MIYLDHAATTPVPRAVADAMYEVLTGHFGNPSSQYQMGLDMKKKNIDIPQVSGSELPNEAKKLGT